RIFRPNTAPPATYTLSLHDALPISEQPAQAVRGERHERHEGGDQRRPAPEHRRRMVGGRIHRQQRLADRKQRGRRRILPPTIRRDRKSTRLNSSHVSISYAVFCLKK